MHRLWHSIYYTSGGANNRDARRIANLCVALRSRCDEGTADKATFFSEVGHIAEMLGGPVAISPKLASEVWRHLSTGDWRSPTHEEVDGWIEAFQAADSARKSLGAYATPAVFCDTLARGTLQPLLTERPGLRIVDPGVGAGSLLLAAHRCLIEAGYDSVESIYSLHGVELDPAARELCVLLLWSSVRTADLQRISTNIKLDNAVTFNWRALDPFDAVLMNPPWESLRQTRADPAQAMVRAKTLARLTKVEAGVGGLPPLYSAQGRGDRNLFKLFLELAPHLLREGGRFGALLPAAFGSDDGMVALREIYLEHLGLERWTSFENRGKYFKIDSRYKFGLLTGTRAQMGTTALDILSFCTHPREVNAPHVRMSRDQLNVLGGTDRMIPELVVPLERDVLEQMLAIGTPMFERSALGRVRYRREVDLTMGLRAGRFWHVEDGCQPLAKPSGQLFFEVQSDVVPVLEGRMISQYDCFQKSWVSGQGRRAVWEHNGDRPLSACRPQFVTFAGEGSNVRVAICDVTSATNTRTVHAALVPPTWVCGNTAPVLTFESEVHAFAGLAILNSMVFDWFARRMVGGLHLNKFYLARLTWPNLTAAQVARLAELSRTVAAHHPRGGVAHHGSAKLLPLLPALAEIEVLTSRAYGLDAASLTAMLANDRSDRRGLWRYFTSKPTSREVAALAIAEMPQVPDPRTTLAA